MNISSILPSKKESGEVDFGLLTDVPSSVPQKRETLPAFYARRA